MSKKQNLDSFFQEKFQNHTCTPNSEVWLAIEARLNRKKTRLVPRLNWVKYSAVAALFLLSSLIGLNTINTYKASGDVAAIKKSSRKTAFTYTTKKTNTQLPATTTRYSKTEALTLPVKVSSIKTANIQAKNLQDPLKIGLPVLQINRQGQTKNAVAHLVCKTSTKNVNKPTSTKFIAVNRTKNNQKLQLKNNFNATTAAITTAQIVEIDTVASPRTPSFSTATHGQIPSKISLSQSSSNQARPANSSALTNDLVSVYKLADDPSKTPIFVPDSMQIVTSHRALQTDSVQIIKNLNPSKLLTLSTVSVEKLEQSKKAKKSSAVPNKWQVTAVIAPIYFGSMANGSPLDKKFIDNEKEFQASQSYGIGINYAIASKIKIRIGIQLLALTYDTKNIAYSLNTSNGTKLTNVTANTFGRLVSIDNVKNAAIFGRTDNSTELSTDSSNTGTLNQKIGYIEVPLELSYKIGNATFNIDLITGVSTFYLQQNKVSLITPTENNIIGEASNLNQFHFSGNIGFGLNYKITHAISASIEPTFKYQLNTFTNNAGNFKPYIIGIYSGIKYSF